MSKNQKKRSSPDAPTGRKDHSQKPSGSNAKQQASGNAAAWKLNDAALETVNEIAQLIRQLDRHDCVSRHEIGRKCCEACKRSNYGDKAVPKLAAGIRQSETYVRNHMRVARTWPDKDKFSEIVDEETKSGRTLSWSHFEELSQVKDGRTRESLRKRALKHDWSFRALQKARQEKDGQNKVASSTAMKGVNDEERELASTETGNYASTENSVAQERPGLLNTLPAPDKLAKKLSKLIKDADASELDAYEKQLQELNDRAAGYCEVFETCRGQLQERKKLEKKKNDTDSNPEEHAQDAT